MVSTSTSTSTITTTSTSNNSNHNMTSRIERIIDDSDDIKRHPIISDIMTIGMAIKSCKSSKMHKMKPRTVKRDQTKTKESKNKTKTRQESRRHDA